jgi:hypothetical protein
MVEVAPIQWRSRDACLEQARPKGDCEKDLVGGGCHLGLKDPSGIHCCEDNKVCVRPLSSSPSLSPRDLLGFGESGANPRSFPNIEWIYHALGKRNQSECLKRTVGGDRRSFVQVVRSKRAHVVMIPPRPNRGWGLKDRRRRPEGGVNGSQ